MKYLVVYNSSELKVSSLYDRDFDVKKVYDLYIKEDALSLFHTDSEVQKAVSAYYTKSKSSDKIADVLQYIENSVSGSVKLKLLSDGTYDFEETDFSKALAKLDGYNHQDMEQQLNDIAAYKAIPGAKKVFTYMLMYRYYWEQMPEAQRAEYQKKMRCILDDRRNIAGRIGDFTAIIIPLGPPTPRRRAGRLHPSCTLGIRTSVP